MYVISLNNDFNRIPGSENMWSMHMRGYLWRITRYNLGRCCNDSLWTLPGKHVCCFVRRMSSYVRDFHRILSVISRYIKTCSDSMKLLYKHEDVLL